MADCYLLALPPEELSDLKPVVRLTGKEMSLIIIEGEDSILVCHKSYAQEIKKVTKVLAEKGLQEVL